MIKFRPLRADEVDLRVDRYTSRGAVLLCTMFVSGVSVGTQSAGM